MFRLMFLVLFFLFEPNAFSKHILDALPNSKSIIEKLSFQEDFPIDLNTMLEHASKVKVQVRRLTQETRIKLNVPNGVQAFTRHPTYDFSFFNLVTKKPTLIAKTESAFSFDSFDGVSVSKLDFIFTEDNTPEDHDPAFILLHELSHIYFHKLFLAYLPKLEQSYPLFFCNQGKKKVDRSFYEYLSERYAYDTHFIAYFEAFRRGIIDKHSPLAKQFLFGQQIETINYETASINNAFHVRDEYKLPYNGFFFDLYTDLNTTSLLTILNGKYKAPFFLQSSITGKKQTARLCHNWTNRNRAQCLKNSKKKDPENFATKVQKCCTQRCGLPLLVDCICQDGSSLDWHSKTPCREIYY